MMAWLKSVFDRLLGSPRLLDLSAAQRQALMTWGMLLGIAAHSALLLVLFWRLERHWTADIPDELHQTYLDGTFTVIFGVLGVQVLLTFGAIAIARGGSMKMSVSKAGATIEADATGAAARELAKETTINQEAST